MLDIIWGLKTTAIFDVWSLEHLLNGLSIGAGVLIFNHKNLGQIFSTLNDRLFPGRLINIIKRKYDLILILFLAYFWESFEHYLETGLAGQRVVDWFYGVEFWPNRLLADPLLLVLGYLIVKKWSQLVWPARAFSMIWLFFNIFIFPHSMYLQKLLGS